MAALLLLTMVSWVGSFAQVSSAADRARDVSQGTSSSAHHAHDCCGSLRTLLKKPALPVNPVSMPCGDEHPCCVRPGPQTTPNLPSVFGYQKVAIARFAAVPVSSEKACIAFEQERRVPLSRLEFSTVLRI
jgi:hypothetical protein